VVTAGLVGARLSYTVMDKIAAAAILIVVVRVGYGIFRDSAKSLLDASLDRRVIDDLRQTVAGFAQVKQILALHARNSGRFVFVYADVTLSVGRLREAHGIACDIEDTIRARVPFVERVTVRYEPEQKETVRYAVPLANSKGLLSEHFGSAPVIAIWDAGAADGSVRSVELLKNPAADREKGKGIGLAQFLIDRKVDVVYTKESFSGKGPDYVLSDADVTVKTTDADTLSALIGPRAPVHSHAP
jgi:predicted Fe-Mo cluster-binding NifX family protein